MSNLSDSPVVIDQLAVDQLSEDILPRQSFTPDGTRTRFRRLLPFVLLCLAAVPMAGVIPGGETRRDLLAGATIAMVLSSLQIVLLPWARMAPLWRHLPSLTFFAGVTMLREVNTHGDGYGEVLFLLAIIWQAMYGRFIDQILTYVQMIACLLVPLLLLTGNPAETEVPRIVLLLLVAAALTVVVQSLIGTLRSNDRSMRTVSAAARSFNTADEPRSAIVSGLHLLTGAHEIVLLEPGRTSGQDWIATAAGSSERRPRATLRGDTGVQVNEAFETGQLTYATSRPQTLVERLLRKPAPMLPDSATTWARLAIPLGAPGKLSAVAEARWLRPSRLPTSFVLSSLSLLGVDAGRALERASLIEELDSQAHRDPVTGLPNRNAWEDIIAAAVAQADKSAEPLSVAIIDLDRFKAFNDLHGHLAGDELLRDAAVAWRAGLRPHDAIARWGGEEFALVLPGAGADEAEQVVSRLQPLTPGGQTFSAGIAQFRQGDKPDTVVGAADAAMYQAKASGRNRVVIGHRLPS